MRLNRYVAIGAGIARRKAEEIIRAERVQVNGIVVTDPARPVEPGTDLVALDGVKLRSPAEKRVVLLNKPAGVIVSVGDTHGRRTVLDLLGRAGTGLYPVGRLDLNTSGVLLLTDDGDLTHRLMHPSFGVEKVYRAQVNGVVGENAVRKFREGIDLDDGKTAPARLRVLDRTETLSTVEVIIHQGRKRQVRRMLEAVGHPVRTLERTSFGGLTASGLKRGQWRVLSKAEAERLRAMVGLGEEAEERSAERRSGRTGQLERKSGRKGGTGKNWPGPERKRRERF
jgi:23S rRNA pseudouridine2605 synthase